MSPEYRENRAGVNLTPVLFSNMSKGGGPQFKKGLRTDSYEISFRDGGNGLAGNRSDCETPC
jgi:hypothetical protein